MLKKLTPLAQKGSNIILVAVPIFHLLATFWGSRQKYSEPLGRNLDIDYILGVVILIANLVFLCAIFISSLKVGYKRLLLLTALPLICVSSYRSSGGHERILETLETNHYRYHLTTNYNIADSWDFYKLYRCYIVGGYCFQIESFNLEGAAHNDIVDLVADERTGYIHVFKNGYLEFAYDTDYQNYDSLADITLEQYHYRLQSNSKPNKIDFVLSVCNSTTQAGCRVLFTFALETPPENAELVYDAGNQSLQIVTDGNVIGQIPLP